MSQFDLRRPQLAGGRHPAGRDTQRLHDQHARRDGDEGLAHDWSVSLVSTAARVVKMYYALE